MSTTHSGIDKTLITVYAGSISPDFQQHAGNKPELETQKLIAQCSGFLIALKEV